VKSIVFAAGGTGGHIFPAIAVADEITKMEADTRICFIGASGKMEERVVPDSGYELETINIRGLSRSFNLRNLENLLRFPFALRKAKQILRSRSASLVFATGGYVSGPVVWAAYNEHIPAILYEGNYYPGLTTRALASRADVILINFPESRNLYNVQEKIRVMPFPVRTKLKKYTKEVARNFFGLDPFRKTIFVFGGSQGASSINNAVAKLLKPLTDANIQLIWQTGKADYKLISDSLKQEFLSVVKVFDFIHKMDYAYSAADLVVCRSGISAVMEVACFALPTIFVPYPHSTDDHQTLNARLLTEKSAAELIADNNLDAELENKILRLIHDDKRLSQLRSNIAVFYDTHAAEKIANFILEFCASRNASGRFQSKIEASSNG